MDSNEVLTSILGSLKQKYNHLNQIYDATRELEKTRFDDEVTFSTLLKLRQNSMDNIDKLDDDIKKSMQALSSSLREKINELLFPSGKTVTLDNPLQTNIFDTAKSNIQLLKRIIDADERFNEAVHKQHK